MTSSHQTQFLFESKLFVILLQGRVVLMRMVER